MLARTALATLMLASSLASSLTMAAPPLPPSNFKFGLPASNNNYPAVNPALYPVAVTARPDALVRDSAPLELFGFNIVWSKFQEGYWRKGQVRPEVINWLKPFQGALYRYPGGTDANYFQWEQSIGPVAQRKAQKDKHGKLVVAQFGYDEYIEFVKAIGGKPILVTNLYGSHDFHWSAGQAADINRRWVEYANKGAKNLANPGPCAVGKPCPVTLWELGNELDWKEKWSAEKYASVVKTVAPALRAADPAVDLIGMTKTAPWEDATAALRFNGVVGDQLRSTVNNYSVHPYYDGRNIPNLETNFLDDGLVKAVKDAGSKIYVTEHALWPARQGSTTNIEWQKTWPTTGDMGGAISTADFILMAMNRPDIGGAIWHALGLAGPWKLFHVSSNDSVYPNVVYWGMRALREAVLDQVVESSVRSPNYSGYNGGYDVRSAVMRDKAGTRYSLLAVNRGGNKLQTALSVPSFANADVSITTRTVSASSPRVGNTDAAPNRVQQVTRESSGHFGSNGVIALELPPYAVVSFVVERK